VAAISHVLAGHVGGVNADEALLTGLMHSIGKIYLLARSQEHFEVLGSGSDLDTLVASCHIPAGEAILSGWDFPHEIVAAVAAQAAVERPARETADLADLLITAAPLPQALGDEQRLRMCLEVTRAPQRLRASVDDCVNVLGGATARINDLRRSLS
jgi:HD-like signal output (HDOD) protein